MRRPPHRLVMVALALAAAAGLWGAVDSAALAASPAGSTAPADSTASTSPTISTTPTSSTTQTSPTTSTSSTAPTGSTTPTSPSSHTTPSGHHRTPSPTELTLPLTPAGATAPITMQPVGLSLEYPLMAQDLGTGACPPAALVTALQQLGSPPLALSGDSQDLTAPAGALPDPPLSWEAATLYSLPATFWSQLHCLLTATKDPLDVGLNLRTGTPAWATQMVAGAQSAATNGLEFSLGNEPDLYSLPNLAALAKPLANKEATTVNLYLQLAGALEQATGTLPVIGPELAIATRWRKQLPRVISQLHEHIVGIHLYPLSACDGAGAVTLAKLLAPAAANAPQSFAWVVADADAAEVPAIISEGNSASCGGVNGVSNSPAAAVWAVRYVLAAVKTGFHEVRFHFSGGAYDPFLVRDGQVLAQPLDSALVALNRWLPVGASIQTLPHVHGLLATAVSAGTLTSTPATMPQLILDNEGAKPQTIVLRGASELQIEALDATRSGPQSAKLGATDGRIKLSVPANSVMAVLEPSPPATAAATR